VAARGVGRLRVAWRVGSGWGGGFLVVGVGVGLGGGAMVCWGGWLVGWNIFFHPLRRIFLRSTPRCLASARYSSLRFPGGVLWWGLYQGLF